MPVGTALRPEIEGRVAAPTEPMPSAVSDVMRARPVEGAASEPVSADRLSGDIWHGETRLRHTGYVPEFAQELIEKGYLDLEVFK